MTSEPASSIGRFEIVRTLGRGSQGAVFLARDPILDRLVAVKLLDGSDGDLSHTAANGAPLEGVIASKLNHPNIVPILEAGQHEQETFLVFEFVKGDTLSRVIQKNGPYSIKDVVPICRAILDGMAAAHEVGILHLDLSPHNVLLSDAGVPRIMDFGLSQFADMSKADSDCATGTLRYMAPEHFFGQPLGAWTDVFALGSTFFELVTGVHAMQGSSPEDIPYRIMAVDVDFAPLIELEHGEAFARFLSGAMQINPQGRYRDCNAMREAFGLFLEEIGVEAALPDGGSRHSTIDFLLRRMQRKNDFPAISSTLADINRLTGEDSKTSADKLANVILRDMALTSKLLKLVNSSFYGVRASPITSISQAVIFLGVEQIRMTANSLALFGALKSDSARLKDGMIRSFMSGLIARHLAQQARLGGVEEAFIAGMCGNLGENLVIYCFAEEYHDIEELRASETLNKAAASRAILGVSYADLGAAVAATWGLPGLIIDAIRGLPPGPVRASPDEDVHLRNLCVFANELCGLFPGRSPSSVTHQLTELLGKFEPVIALEPMYVTKLINAAFEKLKAYAPIFEINIAQSEYCAAIKRWLDASLKQP